jgi:hypothetical protein
MGSGSSKPSDNSSLLKPGNALSLGSFVPLVGFSPSISGGVRKAILIGSNYTGTPNQLTGCINDVNEWKNLLPSWGFSIEYFMTDLEQGINYASKANILTNLALFVNSLASGDVGFIYYSGHGSQIRDTNGDEISGKDSVIVPADYASSGFIKDDDIRSILTLGKSGVNIFTGFDSCNSGSVCDLKYNLLDTSYKSDPTIKSKAFDLNDWIQRQSVVTNPNYVETTAKIISLSGCKDDALAWETTYNGKNYGSLTICLTTILKSNIDSVTIPNLLTTLRSVLQARQVPSLMSGSAFETENLKLRDFLKI